MSKQGENIPYLSLMPPDKEGWLTKQGGSWKSWKKRWFVLKDSTLYYFKSKGSGSALGTFSLRGAGVAETPESGKEFSFGIVTPGRTFVVAAEDDISRVHWMEVCHIFASHGDISQKFRLGPGDNADIRIMCDGISSIHSRGVAIKAVSQVPGVKDVQVSEATKLIDVFGPEAAESDVMDALDAAGFIPKLVSLKKNK